MRLVRESGGGDSLAGEAFSAYVGAAEVCLIVHVGILFHSYFYFFGGSDLVVMAIFLVGVSFVISSFVEYACTLDFYDFFFFAFG